MASLMFLDYIIIFGVLAMSTGFGIFHVIREGRHKTSEEYFLGNRQMSIGAVAVSLSMTTMSAVTYVGVPAEVYNFGPYFVLMPVNKAIVALVCSTIFLPVFYRLNLVSIYDYLDKRFNKLTRYSVMCFDLMHMMLFNGVAIYAPALMLSTASGITVTWSILIIGSICTFYTTVGGIKGVIWTDIFQGLVTAIGFLVMIIAGSAKSGGAAEGWQRAVEGQRSQLVDFSTDMRKVYTFWSIMLGGSFFYTSLFACKQPSIQRFNSCKTEAQGKIAAWIGILGCGLIELAATLTGMVIYSYYAECDPISTGQIKSGDQIVPFYILSGFGRYPGVVGILTSGAFALALSSVSSLINANAAIIGEDVIKPLKKDISEKQYLFVVKIVAVLTGGVAILVALFSSFLGNVVAAVISLGGMFAGPILGVFTLGILCPRGNSKGAIIGLYAGVSLGVIMKVGSDNLKVVRERPPVYIYGCDVFEENSTWSDLSAFSTVSPDYQNEYMTTDSGSYDPHNSSGMFFGMSYLYYPFVASLTSFFVGYICSFISRYWDREYRGTSLFHDIVLKYPNKMLPDEFKTNINQTREDILRMKERVGKESM